MSASRLRAAVVCTLTAAGLSAPAHSVLAQREAGQPAVRASASGIAQAREDSIRRPYTAADIEFMSGMIGHHAQAVKMAGWCKSHDASPSLQIFCGRIITAQTAEIGLMQQWLAERNQRVPEADPKGMKMDMAGMPGMSDMGAMHGDQYVMMPGMLTDAQMKRLDDARGVEFDRLFLSFMMQHHHGAISMVEKLFGTDGAAQDEIVFKFANDVQVDQTTEINRMQEMLDALPPAPGGGF